MSKRPIPRILVVDDDSAVGVLVERVLVEGGYDATAVTDGESALTSVARQQRPYDLFVLDVMMPAMSGDVLAAELRRTDPDVKVLYLTGFGDALFAQKHLLWEGEAYLEKPVAVKGLLEAVSLLLYGHTQGPRE